MNNRLEWSILALAQPADIQLSLFPDFVCKPDELALNFEEGLYESFFDKEQNFSEAQRLAINALDDFLVSVSGEQHLDFWLYDDSLRKDPRWECIRQLAQTAALALGLGIEPPSPSDDVYIAEAQLRAAKRSRWRKLLSWRTKQQ